MPASVPDAAAIDTVCRFFEDTIANALPHWEPELRFHLLDDDAGELRDQAKLDGFFRQFDVVAGSDPTILDSYLPLELENVVLVMVGYLGSIRTRRLRKIVRQDQEVINRYLFRDSTAEESNKPFKWSLRPPNLTEELGDDHTAFIMVYVYEVDYDCEPTE